MTGSDSITGGFRRRTVLGLVGAIASTAAGPSVDAVRADPERTDSEPTIGTLAEATAVTSGPWSDPETWGGSTPGEGTTVTVPSDTEVLLDTDPPALGGVEIGGTLVFEDRDAQLTTAYLDVLESGHMQVGTEEDPYESHANIVLSSDSTCQPVPTAIAGDDGTIGDTELLQAIEYWRNDSEVPGTCGETVDDATLLELIRLWRTGDSP